MSRFTQRGATGPLGFAKTDTDINLASLVGAKFETSDGREFVLVQNAGTALAQGKLVQSPAAIGNHQGMTTSTTVVGATTVTVTLGNTLVTANQYAGGFLNTVEGTGLGQTLKVQSHPAAIASATLVVTLEDPIQVATAVGDTKSSLTMNPYGSLNGTDYRTDGVVVCPTALTGKIIGVSVSPIAASTATVATYGFIQTKGLCGVLSHTGTTIGLGVGNSTQSTPVAGACETYVVANNVLIGNAVVAAVDLKYNLVDLNIS